jgi:TPR repeat protein
MIEVEFEYNNKKITVDVPHDFICVISHDIMHDPVILSDGHSYERNCVIEWFNLNKNISPKTGAQLANKHIIPNYTLKGVIDEIKKEIYDKKLNEQISELEKLANDGDSKAANKLGLTYKNGIKLGLQYTISPDYTKAREYFERSVELNNTAALVNLGELYENGLSVNKDYDTARCYYERAVELNNSQAFTRLGELYELGHGVMKNIDKAKQYYEKAIELGNSDALKNYINL